MKRIIGKQTWLNGSQGKLRSFWWCRAHLRARENEMRRWTGQRWKWRLRDEKRRMWDFLQWRERRGTTKRDERRRGERETDRNVCMWEGEILHPVFSTHNTLRLKPSSLTSVPVLRRARCAFVTLITRVVHELNVLRNPTRRLMDRKFLIFCEILSSGYNPAKVLNRNTPCPDATTFISERNIWKFSRWLFLKGSEHPSLSLDHRRVQVQIRSATWLKHLTLGCVRERERDCQSPWQRPRILDVMNTTRFFL